MEMWHDKETGILVAYALSASTAGQIATAKFELVETNAAQPIGGPAISLGGATMWIIVAVIIVVVVGTAIALTRKRKPAALTPPPIAP